ncbi:MAG: A24 family peptidase [Candidatus Gastranaerophilales bacterium]|nr:A24 family peptidase [Candidatus Gastranaerophilales bacterium]
MVKYMTLAGAMLLMPCLYWTAMRLYQPSFAEEKNQSRKPLHSAAEIVVMLAAEAALVRIWQSLGGCSVWDLEFELLYIMLVAMTFFCMTDYWERVVPNRILLLLLCLFVIILGLQGIRDGNVLLKNLPAIVLGFIFCAISFGIGYLVSHGNMGAGDVKLVLVMGLYLTGEYVVGAVFYGCVIGALYSVIQLARRKLSRKDAIPFVPFLFAGVILRYLIG